MLAFIMILVILFILLVFQCAKVIADDMQRQVKDRLEGTQKGYESLLKNKENVYDEKLKLEGEALRILTLYEITREISSSLNEADAFAIFKKKLKEHVAYEECHLFDAFSDEVKNFRKFDNYFVFTLQGKRRRIAYLVIKDAAPQDKEKIMILGHQFALALRRVKLYEEIEKIAITDSLTGLHTRRYCLERFDEEIKRSRIRKIKLSLMMIDVDFFKKFNDNYGHLTGDQILREIGAIVVDNSREIDIGGRFGGEEFFIILPDTDRGGALYAAERIRKATEEASIQAYDTTIKATVSIGIATYPDDGKTADELIDKADWALYRSKKLGRNRVSSFGVYDK